MTRLLRTSLAAGLLVLAGCASDADEPSAEPSPTPTPTASASTGHAGHTDTTPAKATPLRQNERFLDIAMPAAYTPRAPYGAGTDDYRCFVLDPKLKQDAFLTGIDVKPGNADVVHHVILFQARADQAVQVAAADAKDKGPGWTCFGGTGLENDLGGLDRAPWIGAWAPGGGEQVHAADVGVPLPKGSRIIMQVHYNLLAGDAPDTSKARLRLAPGTAELDALQTVLLPAPVELPCRPGKTGRLCDRTTAVADVVERFGRVGKIADYFGFLCGQATPGPEQSCTRRAPYDMTIRAVAGHMHLLGRQVSITANGRTVLDIDDWNFDDQGSDPVDPVAIKEGDELTVTCTHDQSMRDINPSLEGLPERYVVWGEGTTDEMCLGILLVTAT